MTDLSALYEHWSFSINNLPNIRLKINFELFAEAKPQKVCLNLNAGTGLKGEAVNTKYSVPLGPFTRSSLAEFVLLFC